MKFHMERATNHVWEPLGPRDMVTFIKHAFLHITFGVITTVEKNVENYVEWRFQNTKKDSLWFVLSEYYDIMI